MVDSGMRKLAAAVIITAIKDYQDAVEKMKDKPWANVSYIRELQGRRRECYSFLTQDSLWHQILDIKPEYIRRMLRNRRIELSAAYQ